jgi:hypothetical protein
MRYGIYQEKCQIRTLRQEIQKHRSGSDWEAANVRGIGGHRQRRDDFLTGAAPDPKGFPKYST